MKNSKIFDFAYLSVASYAELSELIGTSIESREEFIREAIEKYSNYSSFSDSTSTFAEIVTENYEVVAHWQDRGSIWNLRNYIPLLDNNKNKSGFSATLFKSKENDEYTIAFRGTLDK